MTKKSELDEVWARLNELDGAVEAIKLVLLHHIAECNGALRHHAESLSESLGEAISGLPRIPPSQPILEAAQDLHFRIRNIARTFDEEPARTG